MTEAVEVLSFSSKVAEAKGAAKAFLSSDFLILSEALTGSELGRVPLKGASLFPEDLSSSCFSLHSGLGIYRLKAASPSSKISWVRAMNSVIGDAFVESLTETKKAEIEGGTGHALKGLTQRFALRAEQIAKEIGEQVGAARSAAVQSKLIEDIRHKEDIGFIGDTGLRGGIFWRLGELERLVKELKEVGREEVMMVRRVMEEMHNEFEWRVSQRSTREKGRLFSGQTIGSETQLGEMRRSVCRSSMEIPSLGVCLPVIACPSLAELGKIAESRALGVSSPMITCQPSTVCQTLVACPLSTDSKASEICKSSPSCYSSPEPGVGRLLSGNAAFDRYPVHKDQPSIRLSLPSRQDAEKTLGVLEIIRENLGKDLSKVSTPVSVNDFLSETQRVLEGFEYAETLDAAASCRDQSLRPALILASLLMTFAKLPRRMRKCFNPLLGETYELTTPCFRGLAEQISHHPPVTAWFCESPLWSSEGQQEVSLQLGLSGMKALAKGAFRFQLKTTGETFRVNRPKGAVHNILFGKMYTWLTDSLQVVNENTGEVASVDFKPKSSNPQKDHMVSGHVKGPCGTIRYLLEGRWDQFLYAVDPSSGKRIELIKARPPPPDRRFAGYMNDFSINLNNLTPSLCLKLPRTDSRLRPDLRAYEHGDIELAEKEKARIELAQRQRETKGQSVKPMWFELGQGKDGYARFNGRYWECRASGNWPANLPDIFG